jgi:hypothetical protein
VQSEAVQTVEATETAPTKATSKMQLSVDGAFVAVVGEGWREVKTMVIGNIQPPVLERGELSVPTTELSYFSRLAEAESFSEQSLSEVQRRGLLEAEVVCAVNDGAEWIQSLVDYHCPKAVRILDFPHAAHYLAEAGKAIYGEATPPFEAWFKTTCQDLKTKGSPTVLAQLNSFLTLLEERGETTTSKSVHPSLEYLTKRQSMLDYGYFRAQGYPIGSGCVESANKIVLEARLKGTGMRWAAHHINPMLALRNIACNDRWSEAYTQFTQHQKRLHWQKRLERAKAKIIPDLPPPKTLPSLPLPTNPPLPKTFLPKNEQGATIPAKNHPWRNSPFGKAPFVAKF